MYPKTPSPESKSRSGASKKASLKTTGQLEGSIKERLISQFTHPGVSKVFIQSLTPNCLDQSNNPQISSPIHTQHSPPLLREKPYAFPHNGVQTHPARQGTRLPLASEVIRHPTPKFRTRSLTMSDLKPKAKMRL